MKIGIFSKSLGVIIYLLIKNVVQLFLKDFQNPVLVSIHLSYKQVKLCYVSQKTVFISFPCFCVADPNISLFEHYTF